MEKSSFLLKWKACAGQRVTLFERLDWKTPCLVHTLTNQLRSSQKDTWAFYASVDGLSLATIKSWHKTFLKSAWRDHSRCSVQMITKSTKLLGTVCVCFLPIHSGHQVRWTYQPGSHRRKVTQDFSSTFFLRCVP